MLFVHGWKFYCAIHSLLKLAIPIAYIVYCIFAYGPSVYLTPFCSHDGVLFLPPGYDFVADGLVNQTP
jgi:hypothetical protein